MKRCIITGGAGFIGSALARMLCTQKIDVCIVDKLTYAGHLESLAEVRSCPHLRFEKADICQPKVLQRLFAEFQPDTIFHLAAESHVDRSIAAPGAFIKTNIVGTYTLLEAARDYYAELPSERKKHFRFQHISTDEVFGDLPFDDTRFCEESPYAPSSPYSASKAAADHLVRAYKRTYDLPVLLTNCSNNFGPYQFPEKLIPHVILCALDGRPIPVYGHGLNVRDWIYVDDHVRALLCVAERGVVGETYLIGAHHEYTNLDVVNKVCRLLDQFAPRADGTPYESRIAFVADRPGHDRRYALDNAKITALGWREQETFESGLEKTVRWYCTHRNDWCQAVMTAKKRRRSSQIL